MLARSIARAYGAPCYFDTASSFQRTRRSCSAFRLIELLTASVGIRICEFQQIREIAFVPCPLPQLRASVAARIGGILDL